MRSQRANKAALWGRTWHRPFESAESILAKFSWINGSSARERQAVWAALHTQSGPLYQRIAQEIPKGLAIPEIDLLRTCGGPIAFCPQCLEAGFHSAIPMVIGATDCPIHLSPLTGRCPSCRKHVDYFGEPSFTLNAIYVCPHCQASLSGTTKTILGSWEKLSNEHILELLSPYLVGVQKAAARCAGVWHAHQRDAGAIFYGQTGYLTYRLLKPSGSTNLSNALRQITTKEFVLPLPEEAYEPLLLSTRRFYEAEMRRILGRGTAPPPANFRPPSFNAYLFRLEYFGEGDLLDNALAMQETLISDAARYTHHFVDLRRLSERIFCGYESHQQAVNLIAAHSLVQIVRQIDCLEYFWQRRATLMTDFLKKDFYFRYLYRLYAGLLGFTACEGEKLIFSTDWMRWISSFQLQEHDGRLLLRVYVPRLEKLLSRPLDTGLEGTSSLN